MKADFTAGGPVTNPACGIINRVVLPPPASSVWRILTRKFLGKTVGGFSLIELLIVLAIIAIIAAIAYPSYERSVLRSHRSDVEAMLTQDAQILERCYTQYFSYAPSSTTNAPNCSPAPLLNTSEHGYYLLSTAANAVTATSYVLTATAQGVQRKDTECQTFTLSSTGQKTALSASGADNTTTCWGH